MQTHEESNNVYRRQMLYCNIILGLFITITGVATEIVTIYSKELFDHKAHYLSHPLGVVLMLFGLYTIIHEYNKLHSSKNIFYIKKQYNKLTTLIQKLGW